MNDKCAMFFIPKTASTICLKEYVRMLSLKKVIYPEFCLVFVERFNQS